VKRERQHLFVARDQNELTIAAAGKIVQISKEAIGNYGHCSIALAGGSTPKPLYELLVARPFVEQIDWSHVHFFWSDERFVPHDHPDSNYWMAFETLLSKIPLPDTNVHRVDTQQPDAQSSALRYESSIRSFFNTPEDAVPKFDLILLGLGEDGHTASLFPSSPALAGPKGLVLGLYEKSVQAYRITFTLHLINNSRSVLFIVSGTSKARILKEVLEGPSRKEPYPAQLVRPVDGTLFWFVDQEAASSLASVRIQANAR